MYYTIRREQKLQHNKQTFTEDLPSKDSYKHIVQPQYYERLANSQQQNLILMATCNI
jgi:hypothetical protein